MPTAKELLLNLDPRGRCNRQGLLLAALALLAIEIVGGALLWLGAIGVDSPGVAILKCALVAVAFSVTGQRLHDCNMSAWRMVFALLAVVVWAFAVAFSFAIWGGPEMMRPDGPIFMAVFASVMLPVLVMALWLHFAKGDATANRFGPVPTGLGFSRPARQAETNPTPEIFADVRLAA